MDIPAPIHQKLEIERCFFDDNSLCDSRFKSSETPGSLGD